jgi:hypothetical protein
MPLLCQIQRPPRCDRPSGRSRIETSKYSIRRLFLTVAIVFRGGRGLKPNSLYEGKYNQELRSPFGAIEV